jgi:hypothetical protein
MHTPSAHTLLKCEQMMAEHPTLKFLLVPPALKCTVDDKFYTHARAGTKSPGLTKINADISAYDVPGTLGILSKTILKTKNTTITQFPINGITGTFSRFDIGLILTALTLADNSLHNLRNLEFKDTDAKPATKDIWAALSMVSFYPDSEKEKLDPQFISHSFDTFKPILHRVLKTKYTKKIPVHFLTS